MLLKILLSQCLTFSSLVLKTNALRYVRMVIKENWEFIFWINWIKRKTKTLFDLKDKFLHPACKIYDGVCSCSKTCIGETVRNVEIRWNEHNMPSVISNAPVKKLTRKILVISFSVLLEPTLNDHVKSDLLHFFKNGIM